MRWSRVFKVVTVRKCYLYKLWVSNGDSELQLCQTTDRYPWHHQTREVSQLANQAKVYNPVLYSPLLVSGSFVMGFVSFEKKF